MPSLPVRKPSSTTTKKSPWQVTGKESAGRSPWHFRNPFPLSLSFSVRVINFQAVSIAESKEHLGMYVGVLSGGALWSHRYVLSLIPKQALSGGWSRFPQRLKVIRPSLCPCGLIFHRLLWRLWGVGVYPYNLHVNVWSKNMRWERKKHTLKYASREQHSTITIQVPCSK